MAFFRDTKVEAFEAAAMPYLDALYRTAIRLTGNGAEAQDIVQNVYLQAWRSFHRFELGTNCRAWLFKILVNEIRHHRRRANTSRIVSDDGDILAAATCEQPIPETLTDEDILAALETLRPEFREVLLLSDVEEFSYKEVAAILNVPVGTVMSRLSRARRHLRYVLKGVNR